MTKSDAAGLARSRRSRTGSKGEHRFPTVCFRSIWPPAAIVAKGSVPVAAVTALAFLLSNPAAAGNGGAAEVPATHSVPVCPWHDLKFSASTTAAVFKPGQPVVLTSTVANRDSVTCSIVVGFDHGYDPSQIVVTRSGKFVWDACDLDNKAGACSDLWILKDLGPGTRYTLTSTWDQQWGQGAGRSGRVPVGGYTFGSGYTDLIDSVLYNASASVDFSIG